MTSSGLHRVTGASAMIVLMAMLAGCGGNGSEGGSTAQRNQNAAPTTPTEPPPTAGQIAAALDAASEYLNADHFTEAEAILVKLVERAPTSLSGREMLGQLRLRQGLAANEEGRRALAARFFSMADEEYRLIVAMDPKNAGLRQSAGEVALLAGNTERALELFREAESLDPENSKHPLYAAQMLTQMQRFDEARIAIDRVITLDFDEPYAFATLAAIELEEGNFDLALEAIREARLIQPQELGFRVIEAKVHRRSGDPETALALLLPLRGEHALDESVVYEIASSHTALGQHEAAARVWAARCRAVPGEWRAALRAAECYLAAGDRLTAMSYVELAQLVAPHEDEVKRVEEKVRTAGS